MEKKDFMESYENVCHTCLRDMSNSKDKEKCLRFGNILLCMSTYWRTISSSQILRHFFNDTSEEDILERIDKNCKDFKNLQLSAISENIYNLMTQNRNVINEQFLKSRQNSTIFAQKFSVDNFIRNSNSFGCLPFNYSNLMLNLRNPFLNKTE